MLQKQSLLSWFGKKLGVPVEIQQVGQSALEVSFKENAEDHAILGKTFASVSIVFNDDGNLMVESRGLRIGTDGKPAAAFFDSHCLFSLADLTYVHEPVKGFVENKDEKFDPAIHSSDLNHGR